MQKKIIFFDVETNGFKGTSVLSISAMKILFNTETLEMIKIGEFDRFYFRNEGEEVNLGAIKINGLTDEVIEIKRSLSKEKYPKTFLEDIDNFRIFCENAEHFVAHNIKFDRDFIPFLLKYQFDTMLENIDIVRIYGDYGYKWPKLMECANYYNIALENEKLHNSMYDVEIMVKVFFRMRKHTVASNRILRFIDKNISTSF